MFRKSSKSETRVTTSSSGVQRIKKARKELDAMKCGDAQMRTRSKFVGEVTSTRIVPRGASYWFEVVISDDSGKINGWFFGRKNIQGLHMGSIVYFEGLVQLDQGEMTIANPYYEFV